MSPHPIRTFALTALVAFSATAATAELAKWDQARVTAIAQQLAPSCDAWEQAVRRQPGETLGSGGAVEAEGLLQNARVLKEQSATLASHLAAGKGHDDTRNLYRSLKEMVDDTEERAQRAELDAPMLAAWSKVADLLRQIAPYYDAEANKG